MYRVYQRREDDVPNVLHRACCTECTNDTTTIRVIVVGPLVTKGKRGGVTKVTKRKRGDNEDKTGEEDRATKEKRADGRNKGSQATRTANKGKYT